MDHLKNENSIEEIDTVASSTNYKEKYQKLKRQLKLILYEQECFCEELRKCQKKCLKVSRDKSFLLDRLWQYEMTAVSEDDDFTDSSLNEDEGIDDKYNDQVEPKISKRNTTSADIKPQLSSSEKDEANDPTTTLESNETDASRLKASNESVFPSLENENDDLVIDTT